VLLVRLLAKRSKLNFSSQALQLVAEPFSHTNDIGAASILSRDGGNSNGLAKTLNEVVGGIVHLFEVAVKLRGHLFSLMSTDGVCEVWAATRNLPLDLRVCRKGGGEETGGERSSY
jgi:hypothetical protein